jgi:glycosyltransferase involved in cell wall biosynthesis
MKTSLPRVSVVKAVYNGEKYLAEAIESVLGQTYSDFELIVVDDGSTDNTPECLQRFAAQDPRIVALCPGRVGFPGALNLGIERSRGEYIARFDADDISLPNRLEKQVAFMDVHSEITAAGSAIEVFGDNRPSTMRFPSSHGVIRTHLLFSCPLSHPTVILRKHELARREMWYRDDFGGVADYDMWCRLDRGGALLENMPEVLVRYRRHPTQISSADQSGQQRLADQVRRDQLNHYGINASPRELEIHSALATWNYRHLTGCLDEVACWLERVESALAQDRRFPIRALRDLLATHWYAACRFSCGVRRTVIRTYAGSRFGRGRPFRSARLAARLAIDYIKTNATH